MGGITLTISVREQDCSLDTLFHAIQQHLPRLNLKTDGLGQQLLQQIDLKLTFFFGDDKMTQTPTQLRPDRLIVLFGHYRSSSRGLMIHLPLVGRLL